jgi:hypothetical protein
MAAAVVPVEGIGSREMQHNDKLLGSLLSADTTFGKAALQLLARLHEQLSRQLSCTTISNRRPKVTVFRHDEHPCMAAC